MTGKQLLNLLNQLTPAELERAVVFVPKMMSERRVASVKLTLDPLTPSIELSETGSPEQVIRPTWRAARRIRPASKGGDA
jgi:hypothetical protein